MLDEYNAKIETTLNQEEEELNRKISYYIKCKDEYFQIIDELITKMTWKELLKTNFRYEALLEAKKFIENYEE